MKQSISEVNVLKKFRLGKLLFFLLVFANALLIISCSTGKKTTTEINPTAIIPTMGNNIPMIEKITPIVNRTEAVALTQTPDWTQDISCQSPCWKGIIPGKTSIVIAKPLLLNLYNSSFREISKAGDNQGVWQSGTEQGAITYRNGLESLLPFGKDIIFRIDVNYVNSVSLNKIINIFGSPSSIEAIPISTEGEPEQKFYNLFIYFSNRGLVLSNTFVQKPVLSPELAFKGITLFDPSKEGIEVAFAGNRIQQSIPWQGYKTFDYYCRAKNLSCG